MTKKKHPTGYALARPIEPTKWEIQRAAERIEIAADKRPYCNSTTRGNYVPRELSYRGQR